MLCDTVFRGAQCADNSARNVIVTVPAIRMPPLGRTYISIVMYQMNRLGVARIDDGDGGSPAPLPRRGIAAGCVVVER
jgi:hypothetical protein